MARRFAMVDRGGEVVRTRASSTKKGTFRVRIQVSPDPKQIANLLGEELAKEIANFKDTFKRLGPVLAQGLAQNIRSRTDPGGSTWDPLSISYLKRKLRKGGGGSPLIFSGRTIGHLSTARAVLSVTKRAVRVGWRGHEWAHVPTMQFGSTRRAHGKKLASGQQMLATHGIGARPFMGFNSQMQSAAEEAMLGHVLAILDKAARRIESARSRIAA